MAVYGPVSHQQNTIWTEASEVHIILFWWRTGPCNDIIGSAKGSQISEKYWGEVGKGKRADVYLEVRKRRGHIFFEWNQCLCAHRINYISDIWGNYLEKNNFYIHSFFRYCLQLKIFLKNKYILYKVQDLDSSLFTAALFSQLYVSIGIFLTCRETLYDCIISLRRIIWAHKINYGIVEKWIVGFQNTFHK